MIELVAPQSWLTSSPKILVIGAGGTGSEVLSRLFKLNFLIQKLGGCSLDITVADGDRVSESNIGRQNFYPVDIGFNKCEILVNRFNAFGNCNWRAIDQHIEVPKLSCNTYDLIISCVDSGKFRWELGKYFTKKNTDTLWLDGGNDTDSGQVVLGHLGNLENKVPNVYDLFGTQLKTAVTNDQPSCSTSEAIAKQTFGINSQIAEVMVQMLWQLLRHTKLCKHIVYVDVKNMELSSVSISPKQWALYGYKNAS